MNSPPLPRGGGRMAAALAIFEPFLRGCTPDQVGLFGVGTSQTDPSIAYIPCIPYLAGPETGRLWTGHYKPASTETYRIYRT